MYTDIDYLRGLIGKSYKKGFTPPRDVKNLPCTMLSQVQEWLREEKNIVVLVKLYTESESEPYYVTIARMTDKGWITLDSNLVDSYNEALSRGITVALELI